MTRLTNITPADRRVWLFIGLITLLAALFIPFSQLVLGVSYTYTLRTVAIGGALLGVVSGVLGCFAILRQQSLMGDALSHAALPGVAVAFLLFGRELGWLLLGAGLASWLGVLFIRAVTNTTRIKQDTAMGIVLAGWFAAGIALLVYIQGRPDASQAGLDSFIFGQAAAIVAQDVQLITAVGLATFLLLALFWKEFVLITFDTEFAQANGFRIGFLHTLLSTLIVIAIVLGLQLAGVVLMVGMLIAPGIAARQWTNRLTQMVVLAAVMGAFAGGTGAVLSAIEANLPTGPMIIVVAFSLVLVSMLFAPERGLVWQWLKQWRDRKRFAAQTVLRDLYRYARDHGGATTAVSESFLKGVNGATAVVGLERLQQGGFAHKQDNDHWVLTSAGVERAQQDALNQRLWDAYRQYNTDLNLPLIPEDRQLDIQRLLPREAVQKLEGLVS